MWLLETTSLSLHELHSIREREREREGERDREREIFQSLGKMTHLNISLTANNCK